MLKPLLSEELVGAIHSLEVPSAPADLVARLRSTEVRRPRKLLLVLPATVGGAIAIALAVVVLSHPTYSWADVLTTAKEQTQYTITSTHLMNGGKESIKSYYYRDGDLWRTPMSYGLKDRTVTLRQYPPLMNYVLIDSRKKPPAIQFRIDKILRPDVTPTVERNVKWRGRHVDIFRLKTTYRDRGTQTFEQELIVDPKTQLPIQASVLRDNRRWGDIWNYDFSKPNPKVFVPDIHKDAKVYDMVKERAELTADMAKNPDAEFITDVEQDPMQPLLLIKGDRKVPFQGFNTYLTLDGYSGTFRGSQYPYLIEGRVRNDRHTVELGGYDWQVTSFYGTFTNAPRLVFEPGTTKVSGSIKIGDKTVTFNDAKIMRTGSAFGLLKSFGDSEEASNP